jgi:hypothetical protein
MNIYCNTNITDCTSIELVEPENSINAFAYGIVLILHLGPKKKLLLIWQWPY